MGDLANQPAPGSDLSLAASKPPAFSRQKRELIALQRAAELRAHEIRLEMQVGDVLLQEITGLADTAFAAQSFISGRVSATGSSSPLRS